MGDLSTTVLIAAGCLALALPLLAWSFTARPGVARQRAVANLSRDLPGAATSGTAITVEGGGLVNVARRLTPAAAIRWLDTLLSRAGRPAAWPLERILVSKLVLTTVALGFAVLVTGTSPSLRGVVIAGGFVVLAWFVPELLLYNSGQKRRETIQLALPDTLDQLTIAVGAGLGFESAMNHVARNSSGPLSEELIRTLQDIQVGAPRRTAYQALADRTQVQDLRRFVRAIIQAEKHGVSISRVLNAQAGEMRVKRRQRAEEKAMQIPVKVVFPLILFILPVLFIVVMGPGVIGIMEAFSGP
jgi:tight adherence protein C